MGPLSRLMHTDIKAVSPDTTLREVARQMAEFKIGSLFVFGPDKQYQGIVTESDLVRKAMARGTAPEKTRAQEVMHSPILTIDIDRPVIEANHLMHFNGVRHLAVVQSGTIVGVLSVRDLVRYFQETDSSPTKELDNVIQPLTILMRREIAAIPADASVQATAQVMGERGIGSLMVTDQEGGYSGIVTESDLVRKVMASGLSGSDLPVGSIANRPIIDIDISASIHEASTLMAKRQIRHLAVTENGKVVGILSIRDLIGMISIRDLPRFFAKK